MIYPIRVTITYDKFDSDNMIQTDDNFLANEFLGLFIKKMEHTNVGEIMMKNSDGSNMSMEKFYSYWLYTIGLALSKYTDLDSIIREEIALFINHMKKVEGFIGEVPKFLPEDYSASGTHTFSNN